MLTSQRLKDYALNELKFDKIGIANIERFKDAPPDLSPLSIMPGAKSVIVTAKRILRGTYRGIDEGTHWPSYNTYCYHGLNIAIRTEGYKLAKFIESFGYEGVNMISVSTTREIGPRGPKVSPDKPRRETGMSIRIAATAAGLGEIGWSKVFLTEEFGPRQRLGLILTDAELEPDPIKIGNLCDKCKRCISDCPAGAISKTETVSIEIEGNKIEWGELNLGRCKMCHHGLNRNTAPFLVKKFPGLHMPIDMQEVSWKEAYDLGIYGFFKAVPGYRSSEGHYKNSPIALCGARGCIIGCMKHLEKRDKIIKKFKREHFSDNNPWRLDDKPSRNENKWFVYDPENDRELTNNNENEKKEGYNVPKWY